MIYKLVVSQADEALWLHTNISEESIKGKPFGDLLPFSFCRLSTIIINLAVKGSLIGGN